MTDRSNITLYSGGPIGQRPLVIYHSAVFLPLPEGQSRKSQRVKGEYPRISNVLTMIMPSMVSSKRKILKPVK